MASKKEVIDIATEVFTELENLVGSIQELLSEAKTLAKRAENLPSEESEIEDSEGECSNCGYRKEKSGE